MKEEKHSVLYCVDVSKVKFSVKVINILSGNCDKTKEHDKALAVVGVTGLVKVMYDGFAKLCKSPLKTFSTEEEAKEWLISL